MTNFSNKEKVICNIMKAKIGKIPYNYIIIGKNRACFLLLIIKKGVNSK